MSRWSRSWSLVQASLAVLKSDRRLLLFPLLSGICSLIVVASFIGPIAASGAWRHMDTSAGGWDGVSYVALFVFYLLQYTVIFFFNTALVLAAMARLEGRQASFGQALREATGKLPQILGYALIAATVGMLLRALEERLGLLGRIVIGLLGAAWSVATFLVVPVLASTNEGPIDAVRHSTALLKRTWGENLIGRFGFGLAFGVAIFVWVMLSMLAVMTTVNLHWPWLTGAMIGIAVLGFVLLVLLQSTLQNIFALALFRYAEYGETDNGFDGALMEGAFNPRRR
ncbi:DUF6159 family protein [Oleiagrimonas sp. C23AA]|uniref:DUF6159 family protein n=1 Tax=Oleiagrimonas sp. C23AA TaxID=2719047 RepID=UPI001421823D|nr:DUF6159 family protein [Oleiagrimonas sp. C23AA]NII11390.1 hypothetical protein [Oleiagrimonas sp. C23AA]